MGEQRPLYIVTGSIKTDAWAIATYHGRMEQPDNALHLVRSLRGRALNDDESRTQDAPPSYVWTKTGSASTRSGRSHKGLKDQTIFIQGFKMEYSQCNESALAEGAGLPQAASTAKIQSRQAPADSREIGEPVATLPSVTSS